MAEDRSQQSSWPPAAAALISLAAATDIVSAQARAILAAPPPEKLQCDLSDALGCVLATPVKADRDQPPFPRVTRDGYAVRAQDISEGLGAGRPLRVIGQLRAGEPWTSDRPPVRAGEAIEIMTGAPLPPGADAVLMVEHAHETWDGSVRSIAPHPGRSLAAGENVVPRGSEALQGQDVIPLGTRLRPEEIALAAACGLRTLDVYAPPRVAILTTGDELAEPSAAASNLSAETLPSHQIYDSNSHSLAALVRQSHGVPLRQSPARDTREDLTGRTRQSLQAAPLLLITGGVSMGRYDLVEEVLAGLSAEFFFTGVKIQPGKPVVFGRIPQSGDSPARFFFGLPGNPVSAMVTFRVFVEPLLAAMTGERHWQPQILLASLAAVVRGKPGLTRFLPARLDTSQPLPTVTPVQHQGSGDLAANARANCYIIVPGDCESLPADQIVRVLLR